MASILQRGPYQWQATVRRVGFPAKSKTFERKRDAEDWSKIIESEMRRGFFTDRSQAERTTLRQLMERYRDDVTPIKRGKVPERSRIKRLIAHPIALLRLTELRSSDFTNYRDERLDEEAAPKTVREELMLLTTVFNTARKEWSIPVENCLKDVKKPEAGKYRERRPSAEEEAKLIEACRKSRSAGLKQAVVLAIETGMRRGEIAQLTWSQVDLGAHLIRLSHTKNGDPRTVPLSVKAENALRALLLRDMNGKVFRFHDSNGIGAAFTRTCKRVGIEDLHFHDLRHEAASRFAPRMPTAVLAKLMGWKTIQMAMRYYKPTDEELLAQVRDPAH